MSECRVGAIRSSVLAERKTMPIRDRIRRREWVLRGATTDDRTGSAGHERTEAL